MHIEPTPPEPTTQRTAPVVRARRGAIVGATALACAALISACGSSSSTNSNPQKRNTARVAASIEGSILTKRHLHATVTCPPEVPQEKGKTFVCVATSQSTKK